MSNTLQLRIDPGLKNEAIKIFGALGLDLSTGIKIYLNQVVKHNGIPFALVTQNGFLPREEQVLLSELGNTKNIYATGKRVSHKSAKRMTEEILK